MRIRINDKNICVACRSIHCAYIDATIKESFFNLRSETTVCPTAVLTDGMASREMDGVYLNEHNCIECGLCAVNCSFNNLSVEELTPSTDAFEGLSEQQYNAIALGYLSRLFSFAANTNRNKSITFDGYVESVSGDRCFVEVDWADDSLECCRRILGDFISYTETGFVRKGLLVLRSIPKQGSRDVFELLTRIQCFPPLHDAKFYITTFSILRHMALTAPKNSYEFSDLFFDPTTSLSEYLDTLEHSFGYIISQQNTLVD